MVKKIYDVMRLFVFLGMLLLISHCANLGPNIQGETVYFMSEYLNHQTTFVVYEPKDIEGAYPVLYLLNGYGADAYAWSSGADVQGAADYDGVLIVSATAYDNWYVDVPGDSSRWYMSYILEIVSYVDSAYNTIPNGDHRAICGISNGARGAIYIASQYPEKFASASALSGAYYSGYLPDYAAFREVELLMEVGTEDELLSECRWLHNRLLERIIPHEYNEFSGGHNWKFWGKRYQYHFDFHFQHIIH